MLLEPVGGDTIGGAASFVQLLQSADVEVAVDQLPRSFELEPAGQGRPDVAPGAEVAFGRAT